MPPRLPAPGLCPRSGGRAGVPAPERGAGGRGGQGGSSRTKRTASRTWIELKPPAAPHSDPASRPAGLLAGGRRVSGAPGSSGPLHPARVRRGEGGGPGPPLSGPQIPVGGWEGVCRGASWRGSSPSPALGTPGSARAAPRFLLLMTEAKSGPPRPPKPAGPLGAPPHQGLDNQLAFSLHPPSTKIWSSLFLYSLSQPPFRTDFLILTLGKNRPREGQ